jgi:hypothetical protein
MKLGVRGRRVRAVKSGQQSSPLQAAEPALEVPVRGQRKLEMPYSDPERQRRAKRESRARARDSDPTYRNREAERLRELRARKRQEAKDGRVAEGSGEFLRLTERVNYLTLDQLDRIRVEARRLRTEGFEGDDLALRYWATELILADRHERQSKEAETVVGDDAAMARAYANRTPTWQFVEGDDFDDRLIPEWFYTDAPIPDDFKQGG